MTPLFLALLVGLIAVCGAMIPVVAFGFDAEYARAQRRVLARLARSRKGWRRSGEIQATEPPAPAVLSRPSPAADLTADARTAFLLEKLAEEAKIWRELAAAKQKPPVDETFEAFRRAAEAAGVTSGNRDTWRADQKIRVLPAPRAPKGLTIWPRRPRGAKK